VVRVLIDETGLPRSVQLAQSSGFKRLDDAALAAVRRARFHPYTENGRPLSGWASIPLVFELEK
jgi:protein TonB